MSAPPNRTWRCFARSSLIVALMLASGCKDKLEDLPDIDPVDDDWVDQIDSGNDAAAVVAPADGTEEPAVDPSAVALAEPGSEPTGEPGDPALAEQPGDSAGDPAAGVDPATAEAAKLGAATVPGSKPAGGSSKSGNTPGAATTEQPANGADAQQPEPAPAAIEPAVAPKPAEPAKPAAPPPITMDDYNGKFRFAGGSAQRQELAEAIEFGANQVSALIRGIARKRLTKTQIIEDPVDISVSGDRLEFHWGTTGNSMIVTIDGPTTTMTYSGDKYKVRARQKDGKLITIFQAPDATKTIVYTMSSDRKNLTAHHKLVADQLAEPVTFKVSYKRQ